MEWRREPRIACYQTAWLRQLSGDRRTMVCYITELSGCSLRIVMAESLPANTAVSIATRDWMALGEVCCARREYAHYAIELELDQAVRGLRDLEALQANWLMQPAPGRREFSFVLNVAK
jgi:hypothetical protein